jgi:hypothetical protein
MDAETLYLGIDDECLNAAIYVLKFRQPELTHPEAWRILTVEAARRRDGGPGAQIRMARSVFEALPFPIRDLFTSEQAHG